MMKKKTEKRRGGAQAEESRMLGEQLSFAASEAYKLLRTNLTFALPDGQSCRVIGVTSAESGEGKSTTSLNLAYMLAEAGHKTLLLESDMRLPGLYDRLGLKQEPGLSNLLAGLSSGDKVLQKTALHPKLFAITSGDIPPNPSELLGSEQMRITIEVLSQSFDYILLDLPPVNEVSDALVASRLADGMLMIVRRGKATRGSLDAAMRQLQYAEAKVLGFVMTNAESGGKRKNYGYGYGYGQKAGKTG